MYHAYSTPCLKSLVHKQTDEEWKTSPGPHELWIILRHLQSQAEPSRRPSERPPSAGDTDVSTTGGALAGEEAGFSFPGPGYCTLPGTSSPAGTPGSHLLEGREAAGGQQAGCRTQRTVPFHAGRFARQPGGPSRPSHGENKEGKTSAGNSAKREALFINSGFCLRHTAPCHPGAGTWGEASRMQPLRPLLPGSECADAFSWPQGSRMWLIGTAETPSGVLDLEGL